MSFFDFDTSGKKFVGLICAFALWLFCSTNVGLLPLYHKVTYVSTFAFTLEKFSVLKRLLHYPTATICLVWFAIVGIVINRFFRTQGKRCKWYFSLLLVLASLFNLLHPWILDIALAISEKTLHEVISSIHAILGLYLHMMFYF